MTENKMSEIAELFGKGLGEEFTLRYGDAVAKGEFTLDGLMVTTKNLHVIHGVWLQHLATGKAVIVE